MDRLNSFDKLIDYGFKGDTLKGMNKILMKCWTFVMSNCTLHGVSHEIVRRITLS